MSCPSFTANGRRSTCRGRNPSSTRVGMVDSCTTGCAIQPRGSASSVLRQLVQRLARCVGSDDEPLAARAVDRLHDEFVEPIEHLLERIRFLEPPGVDVREHRLLPQVVADQVGHVRVDELVVGDAVADGVREGDVAEPGGEHQPRRAQHGIRAELLRVEELVVDPCGRSRRPGWDRRSCASTRDRPSRTGRVPRRARCPSCGPAACARSTPSCARRGSAPRPSDRRRPPAPRHAGPAAGGRDSRRPAARGGS